MNLHISKLLHEAEKKRNKLLPQIPATILAARSGSYGERVSDGVIIDYHSHGL